jgi:hypothetical protein
LSSRLGARLFFASVDRSQFSSRAYCDYESRTTTAPIIVAAAAAAEAAFNNIDQQTHLAIWICIEY